MVKPSDEKLQFSTDSRKDFLVLETDEQRQSLYDPIRRELLRTLDTGVDEFEIEKRPPKTITLEDGTQGLEEVTVKRPVTRYWMTAQELVDRINESNPELGLTNYNCYYHIYYG